MMQGMRYIAGYTATILACIFFATLVIVAECIIRALPYACVAALIYAAYRIALLVL